MKAVILAGGLGTRLAEETTTKPKPMVEIGGYPILWHIMKHYSTHGINEFVICLGYKGYVIKEFFANYFRHTSDLTFHLSENRIDVHSSHAEDWKVTVVDTGHHTMTGGRIKRIEPYIQDDHFLMTYGDGISDIDISASIAFHHQHHGLATMSTTAPPARFGLIEKDDQNRITHFREKPVTEDNQVNMGFFILHKEVFQYLDASENCIFEQGPLQKLASDQQLFAFEHHGFWQPMDTLRDKIHLEKLWQSQTPPWKSWV